MPDVSRPTPEMAGLNGLLSSTTLPRVPVATRPYAEEKGLTLLELSSTLAHVVRQSEALRVEDSNHLAREVQLDIDLAVLGSRHMSALQHEGSGDDAVIGPQLWVPIANQRRSDLASVVVRDSTGSALPRMASNELVESYAAALIRLFRMILDAAPAEESPTHPITRLRTQHRSRWLIEATIRRVVTEGLVLDAPSADRSSPSVASEASKIRSDAQKGFEALELAQPGAVRAYLELLNFTAVYYPLAVLVPSQPKPVYLEFTVPAISVERPRHRWWSGILRALAPVRVFPLNLTMVGSRSTNSFHFLLRVDEELSVRRLVGSTDVDQPAMRSLVNDMRGIAQSYEELRCAGEKILENELQSVVSRLVDLGARREAEAARYEAYLRASGLKVKTVKASAPNDPVEALRDFASARQGHLEHLHHVSRALQEGRLTRLAPSVGDVVGQRAREEAPYVTPELLNDMSNQVEHIELGRDLLVDNDPRVNGGHFFFHRRDAPRERRSLEPLNLRVSGILADDPPSLGGAVNGMLVGVVATVLALFSFVFNGLDWLWSLDGGGVRVEQADAVVTVLLLVPGLLLTRVELPRTNSVLARLRAQNRVVSFAAFTVPAALSGYVASGRPIEPRWILVSLVALAVLLTLNASGDALTRLDARTRGMTAVSMPRWARRRFLVPFLVYLRPAPAVFHLGGER